MNNFARTLAVKLAKVTVVAVLPCFMHIHKILLMFVKGHIKEEVTFHKKAQCLSSLMCCISTT